jgi:hypothetical protein
MSASAYELQSVEENRLRVILRLPSFVLVYNVRLSVMLSSTQHDGGLIDDTSHQSDSLLFSATIILNGDFPPDSSKIG